MGADVYVTKPFSTRDLMARIDALLDPGSPAIRQRRESVPVAAECALAECCVAA